MLAALLLGGCPSPDPDPDPVVPGSSLPEADVLEVEPNDVSPQDLGLIQAPWTVGGSMSDCGEDGDWAGSDIDQLRFSVAEPAALRLTLQADGGDLDLYLLDDEGELVAIRETPGVGSEELSLSLGAGLYFRVRIRCWLGDSPRWTLQFGNILPD